MKILSLENLLISIMGHLLVILVIISYAYLSPLPKIIAPDKIKIIEIDLKDVKIEGLETKLKNIKAESSKPKIETAKKIAAELKSKNKTIAKPIIKTVKVNRETITIDRTLTVSVIDALRISMTRCWQIDSERPDIKGIRAVAHLKLFKNGKVQSYWFESAPRADTDPAFAYVLETIKSAIDNCSPFSMLPRAEYDKWKSVQLTFFPTAKIVE